MTRPYSLLVFSLLCAFVALVFEVQYARGVNSTIEISRTPYLFFADVPNSFSFNPVTTAVTDTELTSDSDGVLGDERLLTVEDTRGCGGLLLQLEASTFTPAAGASLNNNFRVVTSSQSGDVGTEVNGIKYLSGFEGDQSGIAPLNVATVNFSDAELFTAAPFDDGRNILNQPVDLIQGDLDSNSGRIGQMQLGLSFYVNITKYFNPGTYTSTLTFTLTDSTQGNCP